MIFLKLQISIVIFLSCFLVQANQADLNRELWQAVRQGNAEKVDQLISAGADPKAKMGRGEHSFLHIAENLEVARRLLDAGVDPNARNNNFGRVPLNTIANPEVIDLLLKSGADPHVKTTHGNATIHREEASVINAEKLKLLLDAGVDPNVGNGPGGNTLLHQLSLISDSDTGSAYTAELTKILLDAGANPNARNKGGNVPLGKNKYNDHAEMTKLLLEAGADPNPEGVASLVYGAGLERTRLLLEAGADPNKTVSFRKAPIHQAAAATDAERVRLLLEYGANPNARKRNGNTALYRETPGDGGKASAMESLEVTQILLSAGADPNIPGLYGKYPLHRTYNPKIAQAMLDAGANPNAKDRDDRTPIFDALKNGRHSLELMRTLLEGGANPNARDKDGKTPYHILETHWPPEYSRLLLEYGADPTLKDNEGNLPLVDGVIPLARKRTSPASRFATKEKETSCEYTTESTRISSTQCGRRNVCISEVSCTLKIGVAPNTSQIEKKFQVVCSSLSDGKCPKANDCVLDRSMVEAEKTETESRSSSSTAPSSSSGVR